MEKCSKKQKKGGMMEPPMTCCEYHYFMNEGRLMGSVSVIKTEKMKEWEKTLEPETEDLEPAFVL